MTKIESKTRGSRSSLRVRRQVPSTRVYRLLAIFNSGFPTPPAPLSALCVTRTGCAALRALIFPPLRATWP